MSEGRPFFSRDSNPWTRTFGSPISSLFSRESTLWTRIFGKPSFSADTLRRAYHSSPEAAYRGYKSTNNVVWTLIGLNTAVFAAWQIADYTRNRDLLTKLHMHAVLSQGNLDAGRYYTFITSAFSHKSTTHFVFNMVRYSIVGVRAPTHNY